MNSFQVFLMFVSPLLAAIVGICSAGLQGQRLALLRDLLQGVPLGNRAARVGQHVTPVTQLRACGVTAQHAAANRLRCANTIVVNHRDDQRHFLIDNTGKIVKKKTLISHIHLSLSIFNQQC